jgi:GH25 family lysozyme M1 (1,4-beta-N-acetylmuramidase)/LysM repeat protein
MAYRIIDVSSNNGQLDWDTIKSSIDGVIIRIGYGSDIESQDDSQAIRNMQECERLGIPYGVYIYSYCLNIEEVRSEAAHILRMIQGFNPVLGVWFDMEDADGYKRNHGLVPEQNGELLTDFCVEFMQIVKDAGYITGVYANYSYFTNVLNDGRLMSFEGFNRWLAHWGIDEPSMDCLLWQCTSDAVINGSSARTDFNYYYGELPNVEPVIPSEPIEDNSESDDSDDIETKYYVGNYVSYHTIYASSTSEKGLTPSITEGTITNIIASARNPYLINDGTGWINDDCIVENNDENTSEPESPDVEESTNLTHSVGEYVTYSALFASSTSEEPLNPLYTDGTITAIAEGTRNPYLIENGRGWVNDSVINGSSIPEDNYEEPSYDTYEVESGDCLSAIGDKLGVDWYSIAEANGIGEPYTIYPGQSLIIPR